MALVPKSEHALGFEPQSLPPGAGLFEVAGGKGREDSRIRVHYYRPPGFTNRSAILLVIPGAGRNSDDYRNEWLALAHRENMLVAALGYPEKTYDFAAYQMGGVLKNLKFRNRTITRPNKRTMVISLRDEDISFDINQNADEWLFNDFDRVFDLLRAASGSAATQYDVFGHSAGGQILHRMAIFHPVSKARRIVAANAGSYTLPDQRQSLPAGLKGFDFGEDHLRRSFAAPLTLLLGENDNSEAAGGTFLRTPAVDAQGLGRLQRGRTFFRLGEEKARALDAPFRWRLRTVPDVGHDFRGMTAAAAGLLYG